MALVKLSREALSLFSKLMFCFDKLPISNILDNLSDDQSNAGSKYYELASSNADATKERIDQKEDRGCGDMD